MPRPTPAWKRRAWSIACPLCVHAPGPSNLANAATSRNADLSVEGTIELERLEHVLYVGRPVHGQSDATIGLYKVLPGGEAVRVPVKLGRSSVSTIEIVEGLEVGDLVVLSDMSQWDDYARIRLR